MISDLVVFVSGDDETDEFALVDVLGVVIQLLIAHCGKDKINEKEVLKVDNFAKLDLSIEDMLLNVRRPHDYVSLALTAVLRMRAHRATCSRAIRRRSSGKAS